MTGKCINDNTNEEFIPRRLGFVSDMTVEQINGFNEEGGIFEEADKYIIEGTLRHLLEKGTKTDEQVWALDYINSSKVEVVRREKYDRITMNN